MNISKIIFYGIIYICIDKEIQKDFNKSHNIRYNITPKDYGYVYITTT